MTRFHTSPIVWMAVLAAAAGLSATTAAPAAAATTYTITDLGSLGLGVSYGYGINATGQATGASFLSTTYTVPCTYPSPTKCVRHPHHAFLSSSGKMTDLGTLGGHNSQGNAINLAGQVAGWAETSTGARDAAVWTGKKSLDVGGLAPLAGSPSVAYGINDSGQAVGSWGTNPLHAFLYSHGTITSLPESSFTGCTARAINNTGQIAGLCQDTSGSGHLVLWQNGTVTDLGSIGNISNYGLAYVALALNNNGQIAAWTQATPDGYLYSNGTITDLGSFYPNSINDNGVMVGGPSIDSGGTVQNLNSLIPANSGSQAGDATAINDNGQIVAITPDDHTLLLNPS